MSEPTRSRGGEGYGGWDDEDVGADSISARNCEVTYEKLRGAAA